MQSNSAFRRLVADSQVGNLLSWRFLRQWLFVWAIAGVWTAAGTMPPRFPLAVEENQFVFNEDGSYLFSYDTGPGEHQSFRSEERDSKGRVTGRYGYVDPEGDLRITEYQADNEGYRASMLIFHRVNPTPVAPLIVGPLPQRVPSPPLLENDEDEDSPPLQRPFGPVSFIPPEGPVLIIGPLPKPLQPKAILQSPPNLEDIFLGSSVTSSSQTVSQVPEEPDLLGLENRTVSNFLVNSSFAGSPQRNISDVLIPLTGDDSVQVTELSLNVSNVDKDSFDNLSKDFDDLFQNRTVPLSSAIADPVSDSLSLPSVNVSLNISTVQTYDNPSNASRQNVSDFMATNLKQNLTVEISNVTNVLGANVTQRLPTEVLVPAKDTHNGSLEIDIKASEETPSVNLQVDHGNIASNATSGEGGAFSFHLPSLERETDLSRRFVVPREESSSADGSLESSLRSSLEEGNEKPPGSQADFKTISDSLSVTEGMGFLLLPPLTYLPADGPEMTTQS